MSKHTPVGGACNATLVTVPANNGHTSLQLSLGSGFLMVRFSPSEARALGQAFIAHADHADEMLAAAAPRGDFGLWAKGAAP